MARDPMIQKLLVRACVYFTSINKQPLGAINGCWLVRSISRLS
jgi:hypothetical protein